MAVKLQLLPVPVPAQVQPKPVPSEVLETLSYKFSWFQWEDLHGMPPGKRLKYSSNHFILLCFLFVVINFKSAGSAAHSQSAYMACLRPWVQTPTLKQKNLSP
jgi:hypothetical protein